MLEMLYLLFQYLALSWWNTWLSPSSIVRSHWQAGVQEERHLQYHIAQCCAQEHIMTYSLQHPGLGSQGLSASFELQRAIPATHRRHQVSAAVSPARSGNGRNQAETVIYHFKFSSYFPLHRGGGRWGSLWANPPASVTNAQFWDWGGRNSIKGRPL